MRTALIVLGVVVAVLVVGAAIVVGIGALLPARHVIARSAVVRRPARDVHATIRDFAAYPSWRTGVRQVEMLGADRFREHGRRDTVTYEIVEDAPDRIVTRVADRDLGYGGTWTYELARAGDATTVTITERGEVTNVVFRFMSRFVFSNATTIETYLADLTRRLA